MSEYPRALIDLTALKHNLKQVRQLAPHSQVMSVIKADGYGHGLTAVATSLADSEGFAVARLSEAVSLRQTGFKQPITVLEGFHDLQALKLMAQYQLIPVIHQQQQIEWLISSPLSGELPFCWVMLETGMHRLGMSAALIQQHIAALSQTTPLGLMSHFANSDLADDVRNIRQIECMKTLADALQLPICLSNSAAVISLPQAHFNWVRPGLMLYGVSPFADKTGFDLGLKPAMQLQSQLIAINPLQAGDEVGYGGRWTAPQAGKMGVVSIGYGDGFSRHLSNCGAVWLRGQKLPVIGRVSMDTICIDLRGCIDASVGDLVLLWGHPELPIEWQAKQAGTIPYELMTGLTPRVNREYHHGKS